MKFSKYPYFLVSSVLMAGCAAGSGGAATSPANTLTAIKVDATSLDAAAAFWANAPKTTVATKGVTKGAVDGATVTLQAAYDGTKIVIRAEWPDETDSWRRNTWSYDGAKWRKGGDEDRFGLAFPIKDNPEFAAKGCGVLCHNQDADETKWWMGTDSADVKLDLWHWKSAETNPVGQADDGSFNPRATITSTTGRVNDKLESGGPKANVTQDGKGPQSMSKNGLDAHFIIAGEDVPLDMNMIKKDAAIPGNVLSPFNGSRGDISAKGTYANGKWVVVLSRTLNTGHDDDTTFAPPKSVPFGMSVFDNAGDRDHTTAPDVLTLAWK